jgi:MarR family 2-MHQ and catechol resistance regulon transcriptional repressor
LGDLSKKQLSSCGNTTVVVDNLEKEGLVERRDCKEDGRSMYVHLTARGRRLFERVFPEHAHHIQTLASVLSPEEQDRLASLLKKLGLALRDG